MNAWLRRLGIAMSTSYLIAMGAWLLWASRPAGESRWTEFTGLTLNSIGDFLAGLFSPLAFLWLVLGFFQQGEELRQNTEALRLQAEELKQSVEQQRQLVDVARAELDASLRNIEAERERMDRELRESEAAVSPRFHVEAVQRFQTEDGRSKVLMNLRNIGHECFDVRAEVEAPLDCLQTTIHSWPVIAKGVALQVASFLVPPATFAAGKLHLHYRISTGRAGTSTFTLNIGDNTSLTPAVAG